MKNQNTALCTAALALLAEGSGPATLAQSSSGNPLNLISDHATLSVADVNKEVEWYVRVLGFRQTKHEQRSADFEQAIVEIDGYHLDLVRQAGSSRPLTVKPFYQQGYLHIVFRTPTMEAVYNRLKAMGIDMHLGANSRTTVPHLITLYDPEGNEIEILAASPP